MKLSLLAITLATTAAIAAPTSSPYASSNSLVTRQTIDINPNTGPTASQILASINAWISDVRAVNNFVDSASSLTGSDLSSAAQTALNAANDESTQATLQSLLVNFGLSQDGVDALTALQTSFGNVNSSLQGIVNAPDDSNSVLGLLEIINDTRCNIVLPNLDILWPAAAESSGAPPNPPAAEIPNVCF